MGVSMLALMAAMIPGRAGALPTNGSSSSTQIAWPNDIDAAAPAAAAVEKAASSKWSSIYGGVSLSDSGNQLVVHLTTLDNPTAMSDISATAMSLSIKPTFVSSPMTVTKEQALQNSVTAAYDQLKAAGITLASWAVDGYTKMVSIATLNGTSGQLSYLKSTFGPNVEVSSVSALPSAAADRGTDFAPFNGGDWVTDGITDCSTGVPVYGTGEYYLLTAAHCFSFGDTVTNNSVTIPRGNGALIGTISATDGTSGGLDAQLIKQSCQSCAGSHALWTGYTLNPSNTIFQDIPGGSPAGLVVCDDGAFEGQVCDTTVNAQGCYVFDIGRRCHILLATGTNQNDAGHGDSGGPVFRVTNGQVFVVGTLSAIAGTTGRCNNWYPQTGARTCGSNIFYTDINAELGKFAVNLN